MTKSTTRIRNMVLAAMFAALLAVSGQIAIPVPPVPVTLQTLVVMLAGSVLGARWGAASVGIFILLGAFGVPVFSGGREGWRFWSDPPPVISGVGLWRLF